MLVDSSTRSSNGELRFDRDVFQILFLLGEDLVIYTDSIQDRDLKYRILPDSAVSKLSHIWASKSGGSREEASRTSTHSVGLKPAIETIHIATH